MKATATANNIGRVSRSADEPTYEPVRCVDDLLNRIDATRQWDIEKNFNPDTFEKDSKEHVLLFEIYKHGKVGQGEKQGEDDKKIVVRQVATFKDTHFLRDPTSAKLYSVPNEIMKDAMVNRGFEQIYVEHITDPFAILPTPIAMNNEGAREPTRLADCPAPVSIRLPVGNGRKWVPELYIRKDEGSKPTETLATAVVRAYEEKVVDDSTNTVYSPLRLWTKEELATRKLKGDCKLTNRFKIYWTVKQMDGNADSIELNQQQLLTEAGKRIKELKINQPCWLDLANEAYTSKAKN
jgi:hypothetical protein